MIALVLVRVKLERKPELLEIVDALDALAGFLGATEGGQQHAGENCDNRDDYQQFDERKAREAGRPISYTSQLHFVSCLFSFATGLCGRRRVISDRAIIRKKSIAPSNNRSLSASTH